MPTRGLGRLLAGVAAVGLWLCAARAAADERFELDWEAEEGCPDSADARRMLDEYLDGARDTAQFGEDARIEVRIERADDGRFLAEVAVEGDLEPGERRFSGSRCRDVAEAAALIAAMLLDPAGVAERVAARTPAPEPLEPLAPPAAARLQLTLSVHVLGDAGSLPKRTVGGGLALGLRYGRLHASLRASALLPQHTVRGPLPDIGGELGLYAVGLRSGFELVRGFGAKLGTGPSAGLEAGLVLGQGLGAALVQSQVERQLWVAPALGWALVVTADWFSVGLWVEALAPLHRPSWVLEGYGELFRPPPVVGRLSLDVTWLLPSP